MIPGTLDAPAAWAPVAAHRRRASRVALLVTAVAVPVVAVAVEAGGYLAVEAGIRDGRSLRDRHAFAEAEAQFRAVASRGGAAYLLAHGRLDDAAREASVTDIEWARSLAASGDTDGAISVTRRVADPSLTGDAAREAGTIALDAARTAAAAGHFEAALRRLDGVVPPAPADLVAQAAAMRPADRLGAAREEINAGRPRDAVDTLDVVIGDPHSPPDVVVQARVLLPSALLAAGTALLSVGDPAGALPLLRRAVDVGGAGPDAVTARSLLSAPQRVTGTLVHRDGTPAARVRVRLGSDFRLVGGGFTTNPPYFTARTDDAGVFAVEGVPVGASLVFEFDDSGWTVRTSRDPAGREQPADRVVVAPLTPVDLGFVREP